LDSEAARERIRGERERREEKREREEG